MIYETEFGSPGGAPYGALIGDYEFENHPDDIALLENVSGVAAAAFCPFLSAASPKLLGFGSWQELPKASRSEDDRSIPWSTRSGCRSATVKTPGSSC